jgi:tRNA threonylcarbamoyladenosine biosynthesis protein TsaB
VTDSAILAIDTSGATASVALYAGQVLAESTWQSGRRHSAELLPAIDELLARARIEKQGLSAIAVAAGPGSYSGLRVGVSTAMAMALALDIQVAQVPTLDVIAWAQAGSLHSQGAVRGDATITPSAADGWGGVARRSIRAAIDVGRGRYATARFRATDRQLEHETRIESVGLGELFELASAERSLLAVDLDPDCRETVEHQYGARVELAGPAASVRRAGFLAEIAAGKIKRGELVGDLAVEPIYLRT